MPRVCTVCSHVDRAEIDRLLVANEPYRKIAERFSVSLAALNRHKAAHIPAALALAQSAGEVAHGENLLAQVRDLQQKALAILDKAERAGDLRTAVSAIREARGNVELLARLMGELQEQGATVNILVAAPEWLALRAAILRALEPHQEARAAVVAALGSGGNVS